MGQFIKRLLFFINHVFQTIGEATIWILNLFRKLIVWIISTIFYAFKTAIARSRVFIIGLTVFFSHLTARISAPRFSFSAPKSIFLKKRIARTKKKTKVSKVPLYNRARWFLLGFCSASVFSLIIGFMYITLKELPNPHMLTLREVPITTKIYDRNGVLLYEIFTDQDRTPVPLEDLPQYFKDATIAIEDKDFYAHHGFSLEGITRAAYATVLKNDLQGGSTITQQLVRSALLTRDITIQRKVKEILLSIWSEQVYSKDEILEMYFNQVPYGGTAWGAESAAQQYFGKSIRDVTLSEAALLAGLPAAPTTFSPFGSHPELAKDRQREVLRRMEEEGFISEKERQEAESQQIVYASPKSGIQAPHFVMYIRDLLAKKYGMRAVEHGGLRVVTSLDISLQTEAEAIVRKEIAELKKLNVGNGAAMITLPKTGEILAMVGSTDYFDLARDGNVNVTLTLQQPGSTIKVVTYASALQNGFTAASLINDSPVTYSIQGSQPYSPVNYDSRYHGYVSLRGALGNSYNIPAVKTLEKIGVEKAVEQGRAMGITSWDNSSYYGLSLTLGGAEVTMLDMASVYGTLANEGVHIGLTPVLYITDYLGNIIEDNRGKQGTRALPQSVAFIVSDILADNTARSASFGQNSSLRIPDQWIAVKTGTSNDKRDNWAVGYTKDFVIASWVGNNDNSPMHQTLASGVTGATPIWRNIAELMLARYPSSLAPIPPETIVSVSCRGRQEYFIRGTEKDACSPIPTQTPSDSPEPRPDGSRHDEV